MDGSGIRIKTTPVTRHFIQIPLHVSNINIHNSIHKRLGYWALEMQGNKNKLIRRNGSAL